LLGVPIVGPIINLYPFLNVATVPVYVISLRNNFYYILYN